MVMKSSWRQVILVSACLLVQPLPVKSWTRSVGGGLRSGRSPDRLELAAREGARADITTAPLPAHTTLPPAATTKAPAAHEAIQQDLAKTRDRLQRMKGFDKAAGQDVKTMKTIYLANLEVDPNKLGILLVVFFSSMAWLCFYFRYIFVADRHQHHHQFVGLANVPRKDCGDIVFVFDHPLGPQAEKDKQMPVDPRIFIDRVFLKDEINAFPHVQKLMAVCNEAESLSDRQGEPGSTDEAKGSATRKGSLITRMSMSMSMSVSSVTMHELKVAVLQDVAEIFSGMGCTIKVFSSIDATELYLCISLRDEGVINHHLGHNDMPIRLHHDMIAKLEIEYPWDLGPSESHLYAPPYVRFDQHGLVPQLHACGVIAENDPRLVYEANKHSSYPSFIGGAQRAEMLYLQMSTMWDCHNAVDNGIVLACLPMHNQGKATQLLEQWGRFNLLTDLSFFLPHASIFSYLGARVAFLTAWNGLYCKALLGLVPIAIVLSCLSVLLWAHGDIGIVGKNVLGIGYSLTLVVWCKITANLWSQEQHFLKEDWNAKGEGSDPIRPGFRGEWRPSPVDLNKQEKHYPSWQGHLWRFFAHSVVIFFCGIVCLTTYMWDFIFNGQVSLTGSICLAIQIKVFELIFHAMAVSLTELENYKSQLKWTNSFIWKKFIFYSVNSYYPFFYLTVIQGAMQGRCPAGDCIILLEKKLHTTMAILTALTVVQVVVAAVMVDLKIKWQAFQIRRSGKYALGEEPVISHEERQVKSGEYSTDMEVDSMIQLVMPLGFVMLFSPTSPATVLFCFILFAINLRATGTLLLTSVRRPYSERALGIGAWSDVISLLMKAGVLTNGFFLVQYGGYFEHTPILTKCTGILLFACLSALMWSFVDEIVPPEAPDVLLLIKRREHVLKKLSHKSAFKNSKKQKAGTLSADAEPSSPLHRMEKAASGALHKVENLFHMGSTPPKAATAATDRVIESPRQESPEVRMVLDGRWEEVGLFPDAKKGAEAGKGTPGDALKRRQ